MGLCQYAGRWTCAVKKVQPLTLLIPWLPVVPHVEVADQLAAAFEGINERDLAVGPHHSDVGGDFGHWEPAAGSSDGVALTGVGLLPREQSSQAASQLSRSTTDGASWVVNGWNGSRGTVVSSPENGGSSCVDRVPKAFRQPLADHTEDLALGHA